MEHTIGLFTNHSYDLLVCSWQGLWAVGDLENYSRTEMIIYDSACITRIALGKTQTVC